MDHLRSSLESLRGLGFLEVGQSGNELRVRMACDRGRIGLDKGEDLMQSVAVGLVFECDLVVAEEGTRFQITETPRGLGASKYWGLLNYRSGGAFGTEVALTGRWFTAEECLQANLINRVAPKGKVMEVAKELAVNEMDEVTMATPADGPSLGTAPAGTWRCTSVSLKRSAENS